MAMRLSTTAALAIAGALGAACGPRCLQQSVQPFVHATGAPAGIGGPWVTEDDADGLDLVPSGENTWQVNFFDPKPEATKPEEASGGKVRFGQVGATLYWDMTADNPRSADDPQEDLREEHRLDLHSVARVRLDGDSMEIAFLRPGWVSKALADGRVNLAHFQEDADDNDSSVILTARTADLEAFLQAYGEDPEAFNDPVTFHRVP
jgi:hypothetical protein